MNCETCNDLLMDLLYDELDEARANATREHVETCASCRAAWERVSRGRALASTLSPVTAPLPSAAILAAVETAAKENAQRASTPAAAPSDETEAKPGGGGGGEHAVAPVIPLDAAPRRIPTWLHRLGDLAMRRQVAMAAVALLSIGLASRFVPSHTPAALDGDTPAAAPQVIPATELAPERPAAPARPPPGAARPRNAMRSQEMHRAARAVTRAAPAAAPAPPPAPTVAAAEEGRNQWSQPAARDRLADDLRAAPSALAAERTAQGAPAQLAGNRARGASGASGGGLGGPLELADGINAPVDTYRRSATATGSTRTASSTISQSAVPAWRASWYSGEEQSARGNHDAAVAAYRAALDGDPPAAERARIASALAAQLGRMGRVAEAEVVRARYLRVTRDSAAQVDEAQAVATPQSSTVHVPTSVPRPSVQRPARRAMPSATNLQAY